MKSETKAVVSGLSALIRHTLDCLATEQRYPGNDPDRMDENLKDLKEKYLKLFALRTQFELTMSGVVGMERDI